MGGRRRSVAHRHCVGVPGGSAYREYRRRRRGDRSAAARDLPGRVVLVGLVALLGYCGAQMLAGTIDRATGSTQTWAPASASVATSTAYWPGALAAVLFAGITASRLWPRKQSTDAWAKGASGERHVATCLGRVLGKDVALVHDRRIPGTRANIDHIAIGPTGVYVLDAKNVSGRVEVRTSGSVLRRGPARLFVGGSDRSGYITGLGMQVAAVSRVLAVLPDGRPAPVHPMVVLVGARWAGFASPRVIGGVWVGRAKEANRVVSRPGPLSPGAIRLLASAIVDGLPPA